MSRTHSPTGTCFVFDFDLTVSEFFLWFQRCNLPEFNGYYVSDGTLSGDKPVFRHFQNDSIKIQFVAETDDGRFGARKASTDSRLKATASRHSRMATTVCTEVSASKLFADDMSDFGNRWVICGGNEVVFFSERIAASENLFDEDLSSLPPCIGWQWNECCTRSFEWPMAALTYIAISEEALVKWSPASACATRTRTPLLRSESSEAEIALQILDVVMHTSADQCLGFSLLTTDSLEVLSLSADGVALRSGLKAADLITGINGSEVSDCLKALSALKCAADGGSVTLTVCRRVFVNLLIVASRAAVHACNGRYAFERRDEDNCPVFKKQAEDGCESHRIWRLLLNAETGDSLWALTSSTLGDLYVALSPEMNVPPHSGWEPVVENGGVSPGPGLVFFNRKHRVAATTPRTTAKVTRMELTKEVTKRTLAATRRTLLDEVLELREAYYQSWIALHQSEHACERMAERCAEMKTQLISARKTLFKANRSEESRREEVAKLTKETVRLKSRSAKRAFEGTAFGERMEELRLANAQLASQLNAAKMQVSFMREDNERWQKCHESVDDSFREQQRVYYNERKRMEELENWYKHKLDAGDEKLADAQIMNHFCRKKLLQLMGASGLQQFDDDCKRKTQKSSRVTVTQRKVPKQPLADSDSEDADLDSEEEYEEEYDEVLGDDSSEGLANVNNPFAADDEVVDFEEDGDEDSAQSSVVLKDSEVDDEEEGDSEADGGSEHEQDDAAYVIVEEIHVPKTEHVSAAVALDTAHGLDVSVDFGVGSFGGDVVHECYSADAMHSGELLVEETKDDVEHESMQTEEVTDSNGSGNAELEELRVESEATEGLLIELRETLAESQMRCISLEENIDEVRAQMEMENATLRVECRDKDSVVLELRQKIENFEAWVTATVHRLSEIQKRNRSLETEMTELGAAMSAEIRTKDLRIAELELETYAKEAAQTKVIAPVTVESFQQQSGIDSLYKKPDVSSSGVLKEGKQSSSRRSRRSRSGRWKVSGLVVVGSLVCVSVASVVASRWWTLRTLKAATTATVESSKI